MLDHKNQPTFLEKIEGIKSNFNETINCLYDDFNSVPDISDEEINYIMGKFIYLEFSINEESFFWDYISYKVYIRNFEMKKECPDKDFIPAPPDDADCNCNECEYMKMITLEKIYSSLKNEKFEIHLKKEIINKAKLPILKMLEIS